MISIRQNKRKSVHKKKESITTGQQECAKKKTVKLQLMRYSKEAWSDTQTRIASAIAVMKTYDTLLGAYLYP